MASLELFAQMLFANGSIELAGYTPVLRFFFTPSLLANNPST
jgi:hypothetical protein